jgi:hypothetical protein
MKKLKLAILAVLVVPALVAADRPQWREAELPDVTFRVRLVRDVEEITRLLGNDLDREFILVEMEVRPLYNSRIVLTHDDFLLRSYKNNERSYAQSPDLIAGEAVLVLGEGGVESGVFQQSNEPAFSGGVPGFGGTGIGGGATGTTGVAAVGEERRSTGSLLERLDQLALPIGETRELVRGYLYFQVNPKHKPKHLVLNYDGSAGECKILFK